MSQSDPDRLVARLMGSPHCVALGFSLVAVEPGAVHLAAPWREDLVGDPDTQVIAGGVITSLLDHACGMAVTSLSPERGGGPTLDLRIDYMRPAAPRTGVTAAARCYKVTRSIAFLRAVAWDVDEADPVATAQGAFVLPDPTT